MTRPKDIYRIGTVDSVRSVAELIDCPTSVRENGDRIPSKTSFFFVAYYLCNNVIIVKALRKQFLIHLLLIFLVIWNNEANET